MLKRKTKEIANGSRKSSLFGQVGSKKVNRRGFLKGSGIAVGGLAAFSFAGGSVTPAAATAIDANMQVMKSVCTHCSVGCSVLAEVRN
ncbi:MAG: twin-arginine translocation signal domain-containing protein, partial [Flavobacteriales bacterium TMED235]